MIDEVVIEPRFNGPPGSANGGYTCGLVAEALGGDGPASVSLRRPPPLGVRLARVRRPDGSAALLDGDAVVAEGAPDELDSPPPPAPPLDVAEAAATRFAGHTEHPFPTCFVCGPRRPADDGLSIFAGPIEDGAVGPALPGGPRAGAGGRFVASPWTPAPDLAEDGVLAPRFVWAALDCPSAYACAWDGPAVLARLTARRLADVAPGRAHVVAAWPLGRDGRKHRSGSAIYTAEGKPVAVAEALWIELKDPASFGVAG